MGKNLIIKGANFANNCVPTDVLLSTIMVVGATGTIASIRNLENQRSTFVVYDKGQSNTKWRTDTTHDFSYKSDYKLKELPVLAKKIKVTYPLVKLSICLFDEDYKGLLTPSWSDADGVQELNLENYPTAKYYSINIQSATATESNLLIEFSY